jgi:hypothetical protein
LDAVNAIIPVAIRDLKTRRQQTIIDPINVLNQEERGSDRIGVV